MLLEQAFDSTDGVGFEKRVAAKGTDVGGNMVDDDDPALVPDGMHDRACFVFSGTTFNAAVHAQFRGTRFKACDLHEYEDGGERFGG